MVPHPPIPPLWPHEHHVCKGDCHGQQRGVICLSSVTAQTLPVTTHPTAPPNHTLDPAYRPTSPIPDYTLPQEVRTDFSSSRIPDIPTLLDPHPRYRAHIQIPFQSPKPISGHLGIFQPHYHFTAQPFSPSPPPFTVMILFLTSFLFH
jgi:hypothetical protein